MRAISYLPMAHIAERLVTHYLPIAHGWQVTTCADARGDRRAAARGPPRGVLLAAAHVGEAAGGHDRPARRDPDGPTALRALGLDALQHRQSPAPPPAQPRSSSSGARSACRCARSTACPRPPASRPSIRPARCGPGPSARPLPGVEVALSDTGEVLMRGEVIMRGYRNRPARQPRRSTRTAGCTPATSASSTPTAT